MVHADGRSGAEPPHVAENRVVFVRRARVPRNLDPGAREMRERMVWAHRVPITVALVDDPLPDAVLGYLVRSAGVQSPTIVLSRIGITARTYDHLHTAAVADLMRVPSPESSYVATFGSDLTTRYEDGTSFPMWEVQGGMDGRVLSWRERWRRARIIRYFDGAPRATVLGQSARVRSWRWQRFPMF